MKIYAIKCLKCNSTIYSRSRHDFRQCKCRSIYIDGGLDYQRVGFNPEIKYEHVTLDIDVTEKELYEDWNYHYDNYGLIEGDLKK